ncbi:MAG: NAD(P)/FAD-dependent oxidoreductase [Acidimicrobiia bacterium]|nr:NAD(P)/FAD-dependent oxidoreductase [Acidimicrobiia bacterium]
MGAVTTALVLGAGFGGLGAARALAGAPTDVVLVDRHDYHTFQPLLYQVATAALDPETVGHPVRALVDDQGNLRFHQATVTGIDLGSRQVSFAETAALSYDHLVVALGAGVDYFGVRGAAEHAFPLYTLEDAVRLKDHMLGRFEASEDAGAAGPGALDVVVVGGGPTGVETAGALAEWYRHELERDYPHLPVGDAAITLVERGGRLLEMFPNEIGAYAQRELERRGVVVRLGTEVTAVTPSGATVGPGDQLSAQTLVWAAGLQASPLAQALGVELDHGRASVAEDLSLAAHPEVFVVGDIALVASGRGAGPLPQLGSVALQAGEHAGRSIARRAHGEPTEAFHYRDKGTMATIGRGAAVVELPGGHHLTGRLAWLAWGAVHLALLTGGDSRASTLVDWAWMFFTHDRPSRVTVGAAEEDEELGDLRGRGSTA